MKAADDRRQGYTKYSRGRKVWDTVEKSIPLVFDNQMWLVRIMYERKEKKMYLDLREWHLTESGNYEPSFNGITLPISWWFKLLDPIYKLLIKVKGK